MPVETVGTQAERIARAMKNPFESHNPTYEQTVQIETIRAGFIALHDILRVLPVGRERSLAITYLETSSMWAVKGIAMQEDDVPPTT
jgi:hypothetical protein